MYGFLAALNIACAVWNLILAQGCFNTNFVAGVVSLIVGCFMAYLWGANS